VLLLVLLVLFGAVADVFGDATAGCGARQLGHLNQILVIMLTKSTTNC
jgi:hypothetical protein